MALNKVTIKRLDDKLKIVDTIEAMYNPAEVTVETRNLFQRTAIPGLPAPVTQFVSGETQTLSLDLFFDTYEKGEDVRKYTSKVSDLMKINRELHAPPVCQFTWGDLPMSGDCIKSGAHNDKKTKFNGVIDSITQKFTMFLESGIPVRATLSIKVSEYRTIQEQLKELGYESSDHTKHIVFKQGDSLWLLANNEYGSPKFWRTVADANNIDNPRLIKSGTELSFPPLE